MCTEHDLPAVVIHVKEVLLLAGTVMQIFWHAQNGYRGFAGARCTSQWCREKSIAMCLGFALLDGRQRLLKPMV